MVHYKLIYFGGRGRAETARQIFAYAGVQFEDERIDHDAFKTGGLKQKVPFGQVPVLEVDGKMLAQSQAINRYLAHQFGLAGANDWEAAQIDALNDGLADIKQKLQPWMREKDAEKKKALFSTIAEETLKPGFERYQNFLTSNGTGFFVGSKISWFDIAMSETIATWEEKVPDIFHAYPKLTEFAHKIRSEPKIKAWLEKRPKTEN